MRVDALAARQRDGMPSPLAFGNSVKPCAPPGEIASLGRVAGGDPAGVHRQRVVVTAARTRASRGNYVVLAGVTPQAVGPRSR